MKPELSLVIPVRNEAENIEAVVNDIRKVLNKAHISHEIIVVDDGSSDATADIVRDLMLTSQTLRLTSFPSGRGYGAAIRAGFDRAEGEVVGWIDGDNQTDAVIVADLYTALWGSECVLGKAVRVVRNEQLWRRVQSIIFNLLFRILFGAYCRDVNAKPKLMRRSVERSLNISSSDWFIDAEIVIKLSRINARVLELPIEWHTRPSGSSNVRLATGLEFLKNMMLYRLGLR